MGTYSTLSIFIIPKPKFTKTSSAQSGQALLSTNTGFYAAAIDKFTHVICVLAASEMQVCTHIQPMLWPAMDSSRLRVLGEAVGYL